MHLLPLHAHDNQQKLNSKDAPLLHSFYVDFCAPPQKKHQEFIDQSLRFQASSLNSCSSEQPRFQRSGILQTHSKKSAREIFLWNYFSSEAGLNHTFFLTLHSCGNNRIQHTHSPRLLIFPESSFSSFYRCPTNRSKGAQFSFVQWLMKLPLGFQKDFFYDEAFLMANEAFLWSVLMRTSWKCWYAVQTKRDSSPVRHDLHGYSVCSVYCQHQTHQCRLRSAESRHSRSFSRKGRYGKYCKSFNAWSKWPRPLAIKANWVKTAMHNPKPGIDRDPARPSTHHDSLDQQVTLIYIFSPKCNDRKELWKWRDNALDGSILDQ